MSKLFKRCYSKLPVNKMPNLKNVIGNLALDVLLRIFLLILYGVFQLTPPFKRVIQPEEVWLYKNPMTESYCPMNVLWEIVVVVPSIMIFTNYIIQKDKDDVIQAFLSFSLAISLNGAVTNILKVIVGRPRPDFYYRCFPSGKGNLELKDCTGDVDVMNEGLKSFPSGHSSIAFASLGFMSLYMAGKMHLFTSSGKGSAWKLLTFLLPLLVATMIAISRTCDYHHHWQGWIFFGLRIQSRMIDSHILTFPITVDVYVLVGSILGFTICWLCYHNYYPPLYTEKCHIPWSNVNTKHYHKGNSIKEV